MRFPIGLATVAWREVWDNFKNIWDSFPATTGPYLYIRDDQLTGTGILRILPRDAIMQINLNELEI